MSELVTISTSTKIAALFPGQGSHAVGMGQDLCSTYPTAENVYSTAEQTLPKLRQIIEQGPLADLTLTAHQQPALVTAAIAAYRVWQQQTGLTPFVAAGHSLGEYSALVAAGALDLVDALRLTRRRGELMQAAVPVGAGAMSAVMGDPAVVREVCDAHDGIVQPANFNAPTQTVISGAKEAVEAVAAELKTRGLRAIPLKVSAPFHCSLMQSAAEGLQPDLQGVQYGSFAFPVVANVSAKANEDTSQVAQLLGEQITGSVRWVETIQELDRLGTEVFIEFGPGKVLSGLVKRILPDAHIINLGTVEQMDNFTQTFAQNTA